MREWLGFPYKMYVFSYGKALGRVFGEREKPLREWWQLPSFGGECFLGGGKSICGNEGAHSLR